MAIVTTYLGTFIVNIDKIIRHLFFLDYVPNFSSLAGLKVLEKFEKFG